MKVVKESLFEKFSEESDPISDMGIGIYNRSIDDEDKFIEHLLHIIPVMLGTDNIPKNILLHPGKGTLPHWLFLAICRYLYIINTKWKGNKVNFSVNGPMWTDLLKNELLSMGYECVFIPQTETVKCSFPINSKGDMYGSGIETNLVPKSIWKYPIKQNLEKLGIKEIKD